MKILVISPPLKIESYRTRWKRLANGAAQDVQVLGVTPSQRKASGYGKDVVVSGGEEEEGNFKLITLEATSPMNGYYILKGFTAAVKQFDPDLIFCVHQEGVRQLLQTIICRKLFFGRAKLAFFSMKAHPRVPKMKSKSPKEFAKQIFFRLNWWFVRRGTDAALCHYDRIEEQMRSEGYTKPVLQQTQYGVDPEQFCPNQSTRERMRANLGLSGCVIGFCGRFVPSKGLPEIMAAFERLEGDCSLLLVGDGDLRLEAEAWIQEKGFAGRVTITGFIPHTEVQDYFQAMDVFVLGSRETPRYIDTFPLVVAQAMTMGLPVVGSVSGAIPYQLGGQGLLFPEGDTNALRDQLQGLVDVPSLREKVGVALRERALSNFCVDVMNARFMEFVRDEVFRENVD